MAKKRDRLLQQREKINYRERRKTEKMLNNVRMYASRSLCGREARTIIGQYIWMSYVCHG